MDNGCAPSARLLDLCRDQRERWQRGENPRVEKYFDDCPELQSDEKLLLDFICAEYSLRLERGESPRLSEYTQRFPALASQLEVLFEVLEAIGSESSARTFEQETTSHFQGAGALQAGSVDTVAPALRDESARSAVAKKSRVPSAFGSYELIEEVARGGMGVVYKARQAKLDRIVAIKMILPTQFDSDSAVRRFQLEAEAAAKLDHPGVVPIYDVGEQDGQHYLSMAFVDGESLAARIARSGRAQPQEAARIVRDVAQAVQHAHDRGIVHRDLKPANILIDATGRPRVTDFGLARKNDVVGTLTTEGSIIGTPAYMAPEQASGQTEIVGTACDIYSLGAVLYHLLTGSPPFAGSNVLEIIRRVCEDEPKPPREVEASIPKPLESICLKCLAKDPRNRYASAGELAEDLQRFLQGESVTTPSARRVAGSSKWIRHSATIGAVAAIVLLLSLGAFWAFSLERRPKAEQGTSAALPVSDIAPPKSNGKPPLSGDLTIRVWDSKKDSPRRGLRFDSLGAMPLRYGDQIRIEAKTNRPAYLYLVWINTEGEAVPVYPWTPKTPWKSEYWKPRPTETPIDTLELPKEPGGWPIESGKGLETIVLLARDEALPATVQLDTLFSGLPAQHSSPTDLFIWLEGGGGERTPSGTRAPNFSTLQPIQDPTLRLKSLLAERLKPHFPLLRAVCLSNRGS
jgi:serine/threonine protein kinase